MTRLIRTLLTALMLGLCLPVAADAPDRTTEPDNRDGVMTSIGESVRHGWDATRRGVGHAIDVTREKTAQGWDRTREIAGRGADWTREKSRQVWDATREGGAATSEWIREKTGRTDTAAGTREDSL